MPHNPLFSVLNDQLIVSCYEEEAISAVAIAHQKWKEYLRNGRIAVNTSEGIKHYSNVLIWILDEEGDADVYAKSSDAPDFSNSKRFKRDC